MTKDIKIVVALNNTPPSLKALDLAVEHCLSLKVPYVLYVLHFVALNPKQNFPYLDHLEKAYNLEIEEQEVQVLKDCKDYLDRRYAGKVTYKFIKVEGQGETGPLIEGYVNQELSDADMFYVGTRNNGPLKRWALGSVSDYLVHHLPVPVCVVKQDIQPIE